MARYILICHFRSSFLLVNYLLHKLGTISAFCLLVAKFARERTKSHLHHQSLIQIVEDLDLIEIQANSMDQMLKN